FHRDVTVLSVGNVKFGQQARQICGIGALLHLTEPMCDCEAHPEFSTRLATHHYESCAVCSSWIEFYLGNTMMSSLSWKQRLYCHRRPRTIRSAASTSGAPPA